MLKIYRLRQTKYFKNLVITIGCHLCVVILVQQPALFQFVGIVLGIVGVFKGFYWGIGLGVLFYIVFAVVAKEYNPTNFIQGTPIEISHQEILDWLEQKSQ